MNRGIQEDLRRQLAEAHDNRLCLVPASDAERHRLRRALLRRDVVSPAPQVYALPELWHQLKPDERERYRVRSLAKAHPSWVFCNVSAAVMRGLAVSYGVLGRVHLACHRNAHARNTRDYARHIIKDDVFEVVDDVPVTSLEQTVFDCTRSYRFEDSLAIADSALRVSGRERDDLINAFECMPANCRNKWQAIGTMRLADPRAENGGESVARAAMIRAGYLVPDLQVETSIELAGGMYYRIDFYWHLPTGDVAGELDGNEKYTNPIMTGDRDIVAVLTDERKREALITSKNLKIMRFSYKTVRDQRAFCQLLDLYRIPKGLSIPPVALANGACR